MAGSQDRLQVKLAHAQKLADSQTDELKKLRVENKMLTEQNVVLREERNVNKHDNDVSKKELSKVSREYKTTQEQLKQINNDRHSQIKTLEERNEQLLQAQREIRRNGETI